MSSLSDTNENVNVVKKRGRPKTVTVDKKEYNKVRYQANKEAVLEKAKERYNENRDIFIERNKKYMENLKETDIAKYEAIREAQSKGGNSLIKRQFELCKIVKELLEEGILTLPDNHKKRILELIY
jgi:hypothetical protein